MSQAIPRLVSFIVTVTLVASMLVSGGCGSDRNTEADPVFVTVTGQVVDSRGNPVPLATVTFASIDGSIPDVVIETDDEGRFDSVIEAGDYLLTIEAAGTVVAELMITADEAQPDLGVVAPDGQFLIWYVDTDGDDHGSTADAVASPDQPAGYVANYDDCNDTDSTIYPGATESCNGTDDDCDTEVDEGVKESFYADGDGDLFGNPTAPALACVAPAGYVIDNTDCDDTIASINPGATEVCNGVDDNCDLSVDEGVQALFFQDGDTDGFGNAQVSVLSCAASPGFVVDNTDCDDSSSAIYPGAQEVCNGLDDNCDAQIDEGVTGIFFADRDSDLFGNPDESIESCDVPDNHTADNTDCDDTDALINPETTWYTDEDGDTYPLSTNPVVQCEAPAGGGIPGFLVAAFDCNDADPSINPGNLEIIGNGIDDDCNTGTSDDPALFSHMDLAGTWKYFGMNSGDYANGEWIGWMEGQIVFDEAGLIQEFSLVYDDGSIEKASHLSLVIVSAEGIITTPDDPTLHGAISQDKDTIVATYSDSEGGATMFILHRAMEGATAADFAGNWAAHGLLASDAPGLNGWLRGTSSIYATGLEDFSFNRSDNDWEGGLIQNEMGPDGILRTMWHRRSVSADQQLAVGSLEYDGGLGLQVLSRTGGAFAPGNLEGDWSFNVLAAGDAPQINAWHYGSIKFNAAGFGTTKSLYSSDDSVAFPIDALSVDAAGQIVSATDPGFLGVLTVNKDTIVATYTDDSGAANLFVALRRDPPPLDIVAEEVSSVTSVISPSVGGSLQATLSTGTVFQLDIPPDAIDSDVDVQVKMTPLAAVDNLADVNSYLGAVGLAPEGLMFAEPARLSITLPFGVPVTDLLSYYFEGAGTAFRFVPIFPPAGATSTDTFSMDIWHFSGGGGGSGPVPNPPTNALIPFNSQEHFASLIASIVQREGINPIGDDFDRVVELLRSTFEDWLNNHVLVLTATAEAERTLQSVRDAEVALTEWKAHFQDVGNKYKIWGTACVCPPDNWAADIELVFPGDTLDVLNRLESVAFREIELLNQQCYPCDTQNPQECQYIQPCTTGREVLTLLQPWLKFYDELIQTWGLPEETILFDDQCNGLPSLLAAGVSFEPVGAFLGIQDETVFLVYMHDMTISPEALQPSYDPTEEGIVSFYSSQEANGVSTLTVLGESAGQTFVNISEPMGCPAGQLHINVDASGPWDIDVDGRKLDNCNFEEFPDIINPDIVNLTVDPYLFGEDRYLKIYWRDGTSHMTMDGDSRNTPGNMSVRIAGTQIDVSGTVGYEQTCDLDFAWMNLEGTCEFRRYEVTFPSSDVCQGEYWISGTKLLPPE